MIDRSAMFCLYVGMVVLRAPQDGNGRRLLFGFRLCFISGRCVAVTISCTRKNSVYVEFAAVWLHVEFPNSQGMNNTMQVIR